jgi:hypothetical protein
LLQSLDDGRSHIDIWLGDPQVQEIGSAEELNQAVTVNSEGWQTVD